MQTHNFDVFLDSDAFVALFLQDDAHHSRVAHMFAHIVSERISIVTSNQVIAETATVLSHKCGQQPACLFFRKSPAVSKCFC